MSKALRRSSQGTEREISTKIKNKLVLSSIPPIKKLYTRQIFEETLQ